MKSKSILIVILMVICACEASKPTMDRKDSEVSADSPIAIEGDVMGNVSDLNDTITNVGQLREVESSPKIQALVESVTNSLHWNIEALANYSEEEQVKVTLTNISDKKIIIYNPLRKNIEGLVNGSWRTIEVVYCKCRPCPAPPETREVKPGQSYSVSWKKNEDNCSENRFTQRECKPGTYRINVNYSFEGDRKIEQIEFTI